MIKDIKAITMYGVEITPLSKAAEHEIRHTIFEYKQGEDRREELENIMKDKRNYRCKILKEKK